MKRTLTVITGLSLASTASAQAPNYLWLRQIAFARAWGTAPDDTGGVYLAGESSTGGGVDAFVARYDRFGERMWFVRLGTETVDLALGIASGGSAGGVYIGGYTLGDLAAPFTGEADAFIARYGAGGNLLWVRQLGSGSYDVIGSLAADGEGGVYAAIDSFGNFGGLSNAGGRDVFLVRYNSAGEQVWIRQLGSSAADYGYLAPDGAGGVYVAGSTWGSLGGPNLGTSDVVVARYDSEGNQLWIRQFGTATSDWARAAALTPGGVYIAGGTYGSLGGPAAGNSDPFIARLDEDGNLEWVRQFGSINAESGTAVAVDGEGGAYLAGYAWGPLAGPHLGGFDCFIAHYDKAGNRRWMRQFGTSNDDRPLSAAADGAGGVYLGGYLWEHAFLTRFPGPCYPNCDQSTAAPMLTILDFACFLTKFAQGDPYANCDQSTSPPQLSIADFACFLQKFAAGCP